MVDSEDEKSCGVMFAAGGRWRRVGWIEAPLVTRGRTHEISLMMISHTNLCYFLVQK